MSKILVSPQDEELLNAYPWYMNGRYIRHIRRIWPDKHEVLVLHRMIMGATPDQKVDHINGDRWDNRRENLRVCSHSQNMKNRPMHRNNSTGLKGIYPRPDRGTYCASIRCNGKKYHLGSFPTKELAKAAYDEAALRLHGDFARLA